MLISWVARACELWDMGRDRTDGLLVGEDLEAAAKQMWRYKFLYDELKKRNPKWELPKMEVWKFSSDRLLKRVTLANGSTCSYANGEASSIQGDGLSFVVMEEFSLYPYASQILAQAKIVTQGEAGRRAGYVNAICNAKADNANWQDIKRHWLTFTAEEIQKGFTLRKSLSGECFLELDWFADDERTEEWLASVKLEMASTPFEFREQILRQDERSQGALWNREMIDSSRLKEIPQLVTLAVAIDPSVSDPEMRKNPSKLPDECGIIVGGVDGDGHGYVLQDLSGVFSPDQWVKIACGALQKYAGTLKPLRWVLIYEKNQGGELVADAIRTVWQDAPVQAVHASIGKRARAEPVVALYEQGRIHHVGRFAELEREQCTWNALNPGSKSPGRIDALVWLFTGLGLCGEQLVKTFSRLKEVEKDDPEDEAPGSRRIRTWLRRK